MSQTPEKNREQKKEAEKSKKRKLSDQPSQPNKSSKVEIQGRALSLVVYLTQHSHSSFFIRYLEYSKARKLRQSSQISWRLFSVSICFLLAFSLFPPTLIVCSDVKRAAKITAAIV
jgi:hypothetical protein